MADLNKACPITDKCKLAYMPFQRAQIVMTLKQRKCEAEKALQRIKKGLEQAKRKACSHSKCSDPPVKTRKERKKE